ncbi:YihY/virulence factor BrkB family protein [Croceicoccus sp. F390]|uniref:YihY/virulence factor BrkB family protein n=1 Tax=Croceicoccus esteveae TaxID=3075597 RepID=A0ABU2ZEU8_9SPHN|nr:YihY/virulence factor BrkB family protein [Croceicoccus sp. F390]MDT0575123.1 YihY/virulence factor BrkB family protein [Croceicoccus sp. F390]
MIGYKAASYRGLRDGLVNIARQTWSRASDDNIGLIAAGVAFYSFLAMIPLMAATILIYSLVADPPAISAHLRAIAGHLPGEAARLVEQQLTSVVQTSSSKKGVGLLVSLAIALFGARKGAGSLMTGLNITFACKEDRGFIAQNLTGIAITIGFAVMAVLVVIAIATLGALGELWPAGPPAVISLGKLSANLVLAAAIAGGAALLFRFGPACRKAPLKWLSPGSVLTAAGMVLLTIGFGFYVANFGNYNATYGSLGAVVVLLTWIWLSAYILLLGGELTATLLELEVAQDGSG